MTTHRLSSSIRLAMVAVAAVALTACASSGDYHQDSRGDYYEPAPYYGSRADYYDYWYYPSAGFYYDPRIRIYIYQEHDHWIRARRLPAHLHSHQGRHVTIRAPRDRPYEDHPRHRDRYDTERYKQERYRNLSPEHRDSGGRVDAPRQRLPERYRDDRRWHDGDEDNRDRTRDGYPDRRSIHRLQPDRAPDSGYQAPRTLRDAADLGARHNAGRREPASRVVPVKQQFVPPARATRKGEAEHKPRSGDPDRRGKERSNDNAGSKQRPPDPEGRDDAVR